MKYNITPLSALVFCVLFATSCEKDFLVQRLGADPYIATDTFKQKAVAKVDVLWVVDNSESMAGKQDKIANGFIEFINQLIKSGVNYHIGVISTDIKEDGQLRPYAGKAVSGCDACRFLTPDVSCQNNVVGAPVEECQAALVFQNLIKVGISGASYERGFTQVAKAVGAYNLDSKGFPDHVTPVVNQGFLRDDASLYIIFVSDEDEGLKKDGIPIKYYTRIFKSLKGIGNENKVSVSTIAGWPTLPNEPHLSELSSILGIGRVASTDPSLSVKKDRALIILDQRIGCLDLGDATFDPNFRKAEGGTRYILLSLNAGGVVSNICNSSYSKDLERLGADASGLRQVFSLTKIADLDMGRDNIPFSDDDILIDCDGDALGDAYMCVTAKNTGESEPRLVPHDDQEGYIFDLGEGVIRFEGKFLPSPDSEVKIIYRIKPRKAGV